MTHVARYYDDPDDSDGTDGGILATMFSLNPVTAMLEESTDEPVNPYGDPAVEYPTGEELVDDAGNAVPDVDVSVPWTKILLAGGLLLALNAFAGGLAEGLTG